MQRTERSFEKNGCPTLFLDGCLTVCHFSFYSRVPLTPLDRINEKHRWVVGCTLPFSSRHTVHSSHPLPRMESHPALNLGIKENSVKCCDVPQKNYFKKFKCCAVQYSTFLPSWSHHPTYSNIQYFPPQLITPSLHTVIYSTFISIWSASLNNTQYFPLQLICKFKCYTVLSSPADLQV